MNQDSSWVESEPVIMGLWKFAGAVSVNELIELAREWAEQESQYLQLYIRKASTDQHAIGFTYEVPKGADLEEFHAQYFNQTTDVLKRKFGNDFVGWDIASPAWVIK